MKALIFAIALLLLSPFDGIAETQEELTTRLRNEQIARLKAWRAQWMAEKEAERQSYMDSLQAAEDRKREEIKALRKPPARVWRIGRTIMWEPPETAGELQPAGYWVSERYKANGPRTETTC